MGPKSNFILGEIVLLGKLPNSNFTPEKYAHFGAYWGLLAFMGSKSNFTLGPFPFGESPKRKFFSGAFARFGGQLGPFGVQGHKIKCYSGAFFFLGSLPNSKLTPGGLPILGPPGPFVV
jgi:hypothetical protein